MNIIEKEISLYRPEVIDHEKEKFKKFEFNYKPLNIYYLVIPVAFFLLA
ncbi:hypothetical protein [Pseudoalteromonas sp. MMG012]|nr:hypothetical protein [Pseudoalteromonas sp. MMG012]MBQ4851221.1 hypothetical protein [Pseudoalteromonas sp. MMG012]